MPTTDSPNFIPYAAAQRQMAVTPKCARCGVVLYDSLNWIVNTDEFEGYACENCQRILLDVRVTFISRLGVI